VNFTEKVEKSKGEIRSRKLQKNNVQKKKDKRTNSDLQNTIQKTKDGAIRTPLRNGGELMCSGMVSSS